MSWNKNHKEAETKAEKEKSADVLDKTGKADEKAVEVTVEAKKEGVNSNKEAKVKEDVTFDETVSKDDLQNQASDKDIKAAIEESSLIKEVENWEMKRKEDEIKDLTVLLQKLQADFDNFRKRNNDEKKEYEFIYKKQLVEKLIPIIDHFENALKHNCTDDNYALGMKMIHGLFIDFLLSEHIGIVDPLGAKFDANNHTVVEVIHDKTQDDNSIVEVKNKGYLFKDKVIRRARVVVNKVEA